MTMSLAPKSDGLNRMSAKVCAILLTAAYLRYYSLRLSKGEVLKNRAGNEIYFTLLDLATVLKKINISLQVSE